MKLFVCYLGGRHPNCRIELHDVAFCVGESIEDCYESIKQQWFGNLEGLHIDAYASLEHVDGYEIVLKKKGELLSNSSKKQLYFINLGGYDTRIFSELHKTGFYVANDGKEAKERAKKEHGHGLSILHTDDVLEVDNCLNINDYLEDYQIDLFPGNSSFVTQFICGYHLIPMDNQKNKVLV